MAVVRVKEGRYKRIREGHPWVYRTEIDGIEGPFTPGDIVKVVDGKGRLLGKGYINPQSMLTVRLLTHKNIEIGEGLIKQRVSSAVNLRKGFYRDDTDSYRIIFGEADLLPGLIVEKYNNYLVVQSLSLGIEMFQEIIVNELIKELKPEGIYEKNDDEIRLKEGLNLRAGIIFGSVPDEVVITENNIKYKISLIKGQKTGHFLDQRENRRAASKYTLGKRVLDCFCNTGGFSLNAAKAEASSVTSVDISQDAINSLKENSLLNGLNKKITTITANVFDYIKDVSFNNYDVIILDPPAFTKSKSNIEGAARGYKEINLRAMKALPEGGILVTNSCSYHMTEERFYDVIREAAQDSRRSIQVLEARRQGPDHPVLVGYDESFYLKCLILRVL